MLVKRVLSVTACVAALFLGGACFAQTTNKFAFSVGDRTNAKPNLRFGRVVGCQKTLRVGHVRGPSELPSWLKTVNTRQSAWMEFSLIATVAGVAALV